MYSKIQNISLAILLLAPVFGQTQEKNTDRDPLYALTGIQWKTDFNEAVKEATKSKKLIFWIESIGRFDCPQVFPCT